MNGYRVLEEKRALEMASELREREWHPGRASSFKATGTTKQNLELDESDPVAQQIIDEIVQSMKKNDLMAMEFVERIVTPKFNWYREGGTYNTHCDAAIMGDHNGPVATDLACTLFLTEDYSGGELHVGNLQTGIRGKPGMLIAYDCWWPHRVTPVMAGDRICAISWLQSHVPNQEDRDILRMLHSVIGPLNAETQDKVATLDSGEWVRIKQERFAKLGAVHEKLVKRFMRG